MRMQLNANDLNQANKIYEVFQNNNRLEYHDQKSVYMRNKHKDEVITLNGKEMKKVNQYKYLGDIVTPNNTYDQMIESRKGNIRGLTAELCAIMADVKQSKPINAAVTYYNSIIIPKLLLNAETWRNLSKKNLNDLEIIQNTAIKRLMMLPASTPSSIIRSELGIWTVQNQIAFKKLMFLHRVLNLKNNVTRQVLLEQIPMPGPTWLSETQQLLEMININENLEEIQNKSKYSWKKQVNEKIYQIEMQVTKSNADQMKKCKKLEINNIKMKKYFKDLNNTQARTLLKIRTGMIKIKVNYKNMNKDLKCQICKIEIETLEHLLNCTKYKNTKIPNFDQNIFWNYESFPTKAIVQAVDFVTARLEERDRCLEEMARPIPTGGQ